MEYRASLFTQRYFGRFVALLSVGVLVALGASGSYAAVASYVALVGLVVARIRARRMVFSPTSFHYDGWVRNFTIPLAEIKRVERARPFSYRGDRFHGPLEYCITTTNGTRRWVSLLLFPSPAFRQFYEQIVKGRHGNGTA